LNLINQLALEYNVEVSKNEFRNIHTSEGLIKSQKYWVVVLINSIELKVLANYSNGAQLAAEGSPYHLQISLPNKLLTMYFYPKSWIGKQLYKIYLIIANKKADLKSDFKGKINFNNSKINKSLGGNQEFIELMLKYDAFIVARKVKEGSVIDITCRSSIIVLNDLKELIRLSEILIKESR
jgi:hypothetical protein